MQDLLLNFHGVGAPGRTIDPGEEAVWLAESAFLSVLDEITADASGLGLTFDDGNASDLESALPALLDRKLTATFFVLSGKLDQPGYLSRSGVAELAAAGMGIGSHGVQHIDWRGLDLDEMRAEIQDSRACLQDLIQGPVARVACPFGGYNRRVLSYLRTQDIEQVYTSDRGATIQGSWLRARNTLHDGDGPGTLATIRREARDPVGRMVRGLKTFVKRSR